MAHVTELYCLGNVYVHVFFFFFLHFYLILYVSVYSKSP